jgi:hypothetical protein
MASHKTHPRKTGLKKLMVLAMFPVIGISQNSKLDERKGFKNYIFGSAPETYKNITLEVKEGNTQLYSIHDSAIIIDGFELEYLRLTFFKNKLSVISFQTKNHSGDKMLENLKQDYGDPAKKDPAKEKYIWKGNKLHLVYEGHSRNHDATVSFYNDAIY